MTEKDLDEILMRPRKCRDNLARCNEELRNARLKAESNGAIRYDKDRIISSASDEGMVNKVQAILDAEANVDLAEAELKEAIVEADKVISLIDDDSIRNVIRGYYVDMYSCRQIGYIMMYSPRTIRRLKEKGIGILKRC